MLFALGSVTPTVANVDVVSNIAIAPLQLTKGRATAEIRKSYAYQASIFPIDKVNLNRVGQE